MEQEHSSMEQANEEQIVNEVEKAHEMANQENPSRTIAANFRKQAQELAGGDAENSENPFVKELLNQAAEFDQEGNETSETAASDFETRQAILLRSAHEQLKEVTEAVKQSARGELHNGATIEVGLRERIDNLGISDEEAQDEYRTILYKSLGIDPEAMKALAKEVKKEDGFYNSGSVPSIIPGVSGTFIRVSPSNPNAYEVISVKKGD